MTHRKWLVWPLVWRSSRRECKTSFSWKSERCRNAKHKSALSGNVSKRNVGSAEKQAIAYEKKKHDAYRMRETGARDRRRKKQSGGWRRLLVLRGGTTILWSTALLRSYIRALGSTETAFMTANQDTRSTYRFVSAHCYLRLCSCIPDRQHPRPTYTRLCDRFTGQPA